MAKPKEYAIPNEDFFAWKYEDQTKIKHQVLKEYFRIWVIKLGSKTNTLFFDCHGGCGAYLDSNGTISYASSIIARNVADEVNRNRSTKTGIYCCEINENNYNNLLKVLVKCGNPKIIARNNSFEDVIADSKVSVFYKKYPTLFLVDPFGYNFDLNSLKGLMQSFGNEIIVNFMFDYINRFVSDKNVENALNLFFGDDSWKGAISLNSHEREIYLLECYKNSIKRVTGAKYVYAYRLCYPNRNQTYYYLIHATNHVDGITLMKDAFAHVNNGHIQYLGKNNNSMSLFDLDEIKADDIYKLHLLQYAGKTMTFEKLWENIVEDIGYTRRDLSVALIELAKSQKIIAQRVSSVRGQYKDKDLITII